MTDRPILPDPALVRGLLRAQLSPELAHLVEAPLELLGQGWDNVMYKLGDAHVVRLPLRRIAAALAEHEIAWVATASEPLRALGVAVPIPVFCGVPGTVFPWPWTVVPWIAGSDVSRLPVEERSGLVQPLAAALVALHRRAPQDAPRNPYRGVALAERSTAVADRWPGVTRWVGAPRVRILQDLWLRGLRAPGWPGPAFWVHGDIHPRNLLQRDGRLAGIIDFGDVAAGDPAVDLAGAWLTFDAAGRRAFWDAARSLGAYDEAAWDRAGAWAVVIFTGLVADPVTRHNFGPMLEDIRETIV